MDKSINFIINPTAGFGRTQRRLKALIREIQRHNPSANISLTRHPLHAIGLTKKAIRNGARRLVVVGGDGTLNEVVNGYFDKEGHALNPDVAVAMIPSGTGSDFYRSIGSPTNFADEIDFALNGEKKPTDVGLVEAQDANGEKISRHFINVTSMGLSGLVAGFMKTVTKRLGPTTAYFIATVQAIRAFTPPTLNLHASGMDKTIERCSLVSFANGSFFGSGMKIAPNAKLDDGMLDIITIEDLSAMFFMMNGYRVYQGSHIGLSNVSEFRQSDITVKSTSREPIYIETDGELFAQLPARFRVRHHALQMVR